MSESITGAEQLEQVAARLAGGSPALRAELQAVLRAAATPMVGKARASARERLPKAGGLNERIAAEQFVVQDRSTTIQAGVRIGTTASDTRATNRGRIRHPVFGHRDRFVDQQYAPATDWFDDAMRAGRPEVEAAVTGVLEAFARAVTGA